MLCGSTEGEAHFSWPPSIRTVAGVWSIVREIPKGRLGVFWSVLSTLSSLTWTAVLRTLITAVRRLVVIYCVVLGKFGVESCFMEI